MSKSRPTQSGDSASTESAAEAINQSPSDGWAEPPRHPGYSPKQVAILQRKLQEREAQLERKETQLRTVTRQYERLLEERNRALDRKEEEDDSEETSALATLRRLLPG